MHIFHFHFDVLSSHRAVVLDSNMVKTSPRTKNSTETGQLKSEHIMKNKLHGQATGQRR